MNNPIKEFDTKFNEVIDRLKVFAIDTLTYDIRRFVYRLTFKEIFRYAIAVMFLVLIPTLVVLAILASVYTGYLYMTYSEAYKVWIALSLAGFLTAYLFYYFSSRFIFDRSTRIIKLPEATNPAEVFVSRILMEMKNEQLKMLQDYKRH